MCMRSTPPSTDADLAAELAVTLRQAARAIERDRADAARLTLLATAKRLDALQRQHHRSATPGRASNGR